MTKRPIYLDYAATTPVDPEVAKEMIPFLTEHFGNAASNTHSYGDIARKAINKGREQIASLIKVETEEIVFTSGATEAINLAIKGVYESYREKGNHIITVKTEHKAVLDSCQYLESIGADVTYLNVDRDGIIDIEELINSITERTILISVMYANNETGVIQDIKAISDIAKSNNILFMSDATQAVGKINVSPYNEGIDLMPFSSHKLYGPKGIGALYVKNNIKLAPQIHGGGHERQMRSGTLNVPAIVGFGKACELCEQTLEEEAIRLTKMREEFEKELIAAGAKVNGHLSQRLPHISNICFEGQSADEIILQLKDEIAVATGSACNSEVIEPSHVLQALNLSKEEAEGSIRFSFGRFLNSQDINRIVNIFSRLTKAKTLDKVKVITL